MPDPDPLDALRFGDPSDARTRHLVDGVVRGVGGYGNCEDDCTRGPYCGDGNVDAAEEACDDGVNVSTYGTVDSG